MPHECAACGAVDAAVAHQAAGRFVEIKRLIGQSHLGVSVRTCPGCQGHWLVVFTERIDWDNGQDPQYVTYVPLSPAESEALTPGNALELAQSYGDGRRFLFTDWPSGSERVIAWTTNREVVGAYD